MKIFPVKKFYEISNSNPPLVHSACNVLASRFSFDIPVANTVADIITIPDRWLYDRNRLQIYWRCADVALQDLRR
ncbi:MAG: hypothetical protein WDO14_18005 [Bacteroidota bacterium]